MSFFVLPDIPLERLQAPVLGPLDLNGRKEHVSEKWVRVLTLLRYANGRVSKSKYVMAGCIGGCLGDSDAQRSKLSEEARRRLVNDSATKWLGLDQDWSIQELDLLAIPAWMRPQGMDVDNTRRIRGPDPSDPERRPVKFETIWSEDYPGENPELGPRCRVFWADAGLRDQFGIPAHVKHPDFAARNKRVQLRDPRDFPDYPHWRDSLRAGLFFTVWTFESVHLVWYLVSYTAQ
ncbi:hypothetical protein diail_3663 [Diaporthe ilicicola]|nr:hypothetical protein diail_3663 [Diaporthe ilicicola]